MTKPQKASQRMVTPAVRRAAEAMATDQEHIPWAGHRHPDNWEDHAHAALAAALDVEEMARELFVADSWQDREFVLRIWFQAPDDQAVKQHWRRIATALRAAILGPDVVWQGDGVRAVASNLVAVDDEEGESDV